MNCSDEVVTMVFSEFAEMVDAVYLLFGFLIGVILTSSVSLLIDFIKGKMNGK